MAKPPTSPPSSDIGGVNRDRVARSDPRTGDRKAQAQLVAEARESAGRPHSNSDIEPGN